MSSRIKKETLLFFLISLLFADRPVFSGLYNAQTFTLKNGLQVYVIENHRTDLVSQIICYRVGAADDPLGKSGLAHYLEHMMFKGPAGSSSFEIMGFVDNVGGSINASTGVDTTMYYETVPKEYLSKIMKMEAERMMRLDVLPEQAHPELKVILEERKMRVGNDPFGQFSIDLDAAVFRHHPYKNPPIGWEHEIRTYTPTDVKKEHEKWYAPNNALLILSGNITLKEAKDLSEKYYGPIPARKLPKRDRVIEPPLTDKVIVETQTNKINQPYIIFLFKAPNHRTAKHNEVIALEILSHALGGSMNSYLYRQLVEDQKIASGVSAGYDDFTLDPKYFKISAQVTSNSTIPKLESAIEDELKKLIKTGLTEEQVGKAKKHLLASVDYIRDSLLSGADNLAQGLSVGVPLAQMENWTENIKRVTTEQVNQALRTVFDTPHYVIGYLTPKPDQHEIPKEKV